MTEITQFVSKLRHAASESHGHVVELLEMAADLIEAAHTPKDGVAAGEIPYKVIAELYTSTLKDYLPPAKGMPPMRRRMIAQRWQEDKERQSTEWWANYWKTVAASDFLCGRSPPRPGHENWRANFDWFLKPSNMTKVLEGNYTNRGPRIDADRITRY
jgi:hypothetical protein